MKNILIIAVLFILPFSLRSQDDALPERIVENVSNGIIVTYKFPKPIIQPNRLIQETYFLRFNGFGINEVPGEPAVPFRSDLFYIPTGYNTRVDLIEQTYIDTSLVLSPSNLFSEYENHTNSDSITPYQGFFPNSILEPGVLDNYRGVGLQRITIVPIQYNYEQHIVRSYSKIKYKITFQQRANGTRENDNLGINKIKNYLSRITLNHSSFPTSVFKNAPSPENDAKNYLIITTNNYLDSIQHFIEWKRIKGNRVFIESRNIGEWTTDNIEHVIDSINSSRPLDYVLLIGGYDDVPAESFVYYGGGTYRYGVTDFAYGLPSQNLQIAQISRGRLPVDSPQELSIILNKIIRYEQRPIDDEYFYRTALHCGEFSDYDPNDTYEDDCAVLTNENLHYHLTHNYNYLINRSYYYVDYNFVNIPDTLKMHWNNKSFSYGQALPDSLQPSSGFNWKPQNSVLHNINDGTLYVLYVGHGSERGWEAPVFTSQVTSLQNGHKLPIVFSIACSTGKYNENGDCFVEKMLKKENGGCVGIFAATEVCFPQFSASMTYGMFDAVWPNLHNIYGFKNYDTESYTSSDNSFYEMGKILDLGLIRMAETSGLHDPYDRKEITNKLFHYFGDPSMMIYTDSPKEFKGPTIKYVNEKLYVLSPCDSTRITFYTPSATNPTIDSFIGNSIEYETNADSVVICLDKHNYVPYVQTFHKNLYIQNETINDARTYVGDNILIGNHVTTEKPSGNVVIENAKVTIQGNSVELHPGTKIIHSNVLINKRE